MWMRYTVSIARQCGRSIPRRQPAGAGKVPTPLAARTRDIAPFHVMDLLARARALEAARRSIIHMKNNKPNFPTPAPVIEAGIRALRDGRTQYTPEMGLPALREAISDFYRARLGVVVAPERIVVTPGASGALQLALAVLVGPGSEVLMADPGYPCNRHLVRLLEGRAVALPVDAASYFQPTAAQVAAHWRAETVAALLATPANPTGTLIDPADKPGIPDADEDPGAPHDVAEIKHAL